MSDNLLSAIANEIKDQMDKDIIDRLWTVTYQNMLDEMPTEERHHLRALTALMPDVKRLYVKNVITTRLVWLRKRATGKFRFRFRGSVFTIDTEMCINPVVEFTKDFNGDTKALMFPYKWEHPYSIFVEGLFA